MPYTDPEAQRKAVREGTRRYRSRRRGETAPTKPSAIPVGPLLPPDFRLRTIADAIVVLEKNIGAVDAEPTIPVGEKARIASTLIGVFIRAHEASNTEARIAALEAVINERSAIG